MLSNRCEVKLTRRAKKDVLDLKRWTERITRTLAGLENTPDLGHSLQGTLKGARALEFSLPGGQYRAAYVIRENVSNDEDPKQTHTVCLVFMVGPHENFYREAERRLKGLRKDGEV